MPQRLPWNSASQSDHHNNTECAAGNSIPAQDYRTGTDGKPLCPECDRLNRAGK
jgi:hypothetical protein